MNRRIILSVLALVFALSTMPSRAFADENVNPENGKQIVKSVVKAKLLAKLLKRAMFRKQLAEAVKGHSSSCFEAFSEKVKNRIEEAIAKIKAKAAEEGITIGEFVPEGTFETAREARIEARHQKILKRLMELKGTRMERVFLRFVIRGSHRLSELQEQILEHATGALKMALEEHETALTELREEARQLLGSEEVE